MASASFSVCEYWHSTGVSVRLAYATTHLSSEAGAFCTNMADSPVGEASVMSSVSFLGSKYAMTLELVRSSFIFWKDCSSDANQWNGSSFLVNSHSGVDTSLKFSMNLARYVSIPRKLVYSSGCYRCWSILDCLYLLGVRSNSITREHESEECHRGLVELALLPI